MELSTLTGNITSSGNLALNGGSLTTTTAATGNLFNTTATTLNVGGAANAINIGSANSLTTLNNNLAVLNSATVSATLTASNNFQANGNSVFTPTASNNVTVNTSTSNFLVLNGLQNSTGTTLCLNGSNELITCTGQTLSLQNAYNGGNTITTGNNDNIAFTLANTSTASNFTVNTANGSNRITVFFSLSAGGSATVPNELIQVDNQNASNTLPTGIR